MTKFNLIAFLFIISGTLLSCKKKNEDAKYVFAISTKDYYSNEIQSNISISAYTKTVSSGTFSNTYNLEASELSNSNGLCNIEIPYKAIESMKFEAKSNGYFTVQEIFNPDIFTTTEVNNIDILIKKKGVLKFNITNTSPFDSYDNILLNTLNSSCPECSNYNSLSLSGTAIDTSFTGNIALNRYYKYQYFVKKNSQTSTYLDSILCQNDTTLIEINY